MKPTRNILFGLVIASAALIAGSVTIPNAFTANTTAKASEVNANFSAIKTAVNGNADDISDNANDIATNKADITTNANDMITGVTATNGLSGGGSSGSVTVRRADGNVSIAPAMFASQNNNGCYWYRWANTGFFDTTSTKANCAAFGSVFLPDGATIKSLTCHFKNNDTSIATNPTASFDRLESSTGAPDILFTVTSGGDTSTIQSITDDSIDDASHATVDNGKYSYVIFYDPPDHTDGAGSNQELIGCSVEYSYQ